MPYQILFSKQVAKDLRGIPQKIASHILSEIELLRENPRPNGIKKLSGSDNLYRIRVGDYRIVYTIEDHILTIEVVKIGHRKDVYQ